MKKFCDKVAKQQWRVTVPNINTKFFKKREETSGKKSPAKSSSGCYDLEAAQREFDRCRSVPNGAAFIDTDSSDSESYQDARMSSDKRSSANFTSDDDVELYVDVDSKFPESAPENHSQFEYDVPKISFSFFENEEYAMVANQPQETETIEKHKSEVIIVLEQDGHHECETSTESEHGDENANVEETVVETKTVDLCLTKDLGFPSIPMMKSGSDPNIHYRCIREEVEPEEEFYKVPVPTKRKRLSQSLTNVEIENLDGITSNHSSIEHISCSQILAQKCEEEQPKSTQNSEMDYCKVRSKLPLKLRRATLLRRPKTKAVDTWVSLRTKFNIMSEHSAQQRVGAFEDKEKLSINIEEVYKNSKDKCKRVLKNTGKLFNKNRRNQEFDDASSQIVKNHAFFAKVDLKASDIEYKLNYDNPEGANDEKKKTVEAESPMSNSSSQKSFSRSVSEEKREEFDFNSIKSAFRKSKVIPEVRKFAC